MESSLNPFITSVFVTGILIFVTGNMISAAIILNCEAASSFSEARGKEEKLKVLVVLRSETNFKEEK